MELINYKLRANSGYMRLNQYFPEFSYPCWWADSRRANIKPAYYNRALNGELRGEMESYESLDDIIKKYVDKTKPVLDAGCGDAQLLVGLRQNKYLAEGIELEESVVQAVKKLFSDLPIQVGNALAIERPNCFYGTYISLGVVEHYQQGPLAFLYEAKRVLIPGGIMLISVPYINFIRYAKMVLNIYKMRPEGNNDFFQYCFSVKEFTTMLKAVGFKILEKREYGMIFSLVRLDLPCLSKYYDKWGFFYQTIRCLARNFHRRNGLSNMMLFVCKKID